MRFKAWSLAAAGIAGVAALGAAVFSLWIRPRAIQEERRIRQETHREIARQPFVRAKVDSGYRLVTGRRCASLVPDTSGAVEFCLEKKSKAGDVLRYTFERYTYEARDSGACRIRPRTENGWECLP